MRKSKAVITFTLAVCMLTGCHMSHEWQEATCTTPRTCKVGGETEGEALGHTWVDATCTTPRTCSVCAATEGEALGHTWIDATCTMPRTCSVCAATEGEALGHDLTEANYQQAATCTVCGEIVGEPLTAYYEEKGIVCDAELDIEYPYTVLCYENHDYTTTGRVTFSDFEVFSSDETHEALEGYEWQAVTVTGVFDDANAQNYGRSIYLNVDDYYVHSEEVAYFENIKLNYNGVDYEECRREYELLKSGWVGQVDTVQYRLYSRLPEGYDGWVIYAETNTGADDTLYFRPKK